MAERLPRYQSQPSSLIAPRIDYAGAGAAEARALQGLSGALDRMSQYAFKEAAARAEREGAEWGFTAEITPEQISTALQEGRDIDEIIGDPGTVFGSASRASVGLRLKTQLESQAREKMSVISAMIEGGENIDPVKLQSDITDMMAGHSEVLGQIDPKMAYNYRATVGTLASSVYKTSLAKRYELDNAIVSAEAQRSAVATLDEINNIYDMGTGAYVEVNGKQILLSDAQAEVAIKSAMDMAIETRNPDIIKETSDALKNAQIESKVNALRKFARENPDAVDLSSGYFGDKTDLYLSLNEEQKEIVRDEARDEAGAMHTEDETLRSDQRNELTRRASALQAQLSAMPNDDPRRQGLFSELQALAETGDAGVTPSELRAARSYDREVPKSDPISVGQARNLILNNAITSVTELNAYAQSNDININDLNTLIKDLDSVQDENKNEARRGLREARGVSGIGLAPEDVGLYVFESLPKIEAANKKDNEQISNENDKLRAQGKPELPYVTFGESVRKFIDNKIGVAKWERIDSQRAQLQKFYGESVNFDFTNSTVADLGLLLKSLENNTNLKPRLKDDLTEAIKSLLRMYEQ